MADQDTTQLLKDVPLFSDLNDKEQQVAQSMKRRQFSAGQEIAREGESGVGFFVIEDGNAKVTVHGEEKRRLGPGDYFGEIALIAQSADRVRHCRERPDRARDDVLGLPPLVEGNSSIAWKLLQSFAKTYGPDET